MIAADYREAMHSRDVDLSATHDPLTGLPSARAWGVATAWAVDQARAQGDTVTLALVDVERFVSLADADPRGADRLLKEVAAGWHAELDDRGLVSRLIGGRFGLLLPGSDAGSALELIEALRDRIPGGHPCAAGLAEWAGEDPARLVARADAALVGARLHGCGRPAVA